MKVKDIDIARAELCERVVKRKMERFGGIPTEVDRYLSLLVIFC
jgi:hypothetical protein